jgi:alpha,alpha-trehalase
MNYCWNEGNGFFMDYDFSIGKSTPVLSLAGLYPLFFELASPEQARLVSEKVAELFLKPGGVVTTLNTTGEQWDAPNGWAPLQWICIRGLRNYGYNKLADEIKYRWMRVTEKEYYKSYKLLEKYNVVDIEAEGGGGEYPNQDGFGWTNGVYQHLAKETSANVKSQGTKTK